jgi:hypothetical protein
MTSLFIILNIIIMWLIIAPILDITYKLAVQEENFGLVLSATVCTMALFTMCFLAPVFTFSILMILTIIDKACERVR